MGSSVDSTADATFRLFPKFPFEVRKKVWIRAVFPRTITCALGWRPRWSVIAGNFQSDTYSYGTTPPPPLLQVCTESREVAIRKRLYRAALWPRFLRIPQSPRYTWVNFELDTIRLSVHMLRQLSAADRRHIRRLFINSTDDQD